jgi:hypothetical protein
MKLEKFDLEKVIHGAKVVTRDGREVTQLSKFDTYDKFCLYGVVDDEVEFWSIEGRYSEYSTSNMDLYIMAEVARGWLNIFKNQYGNLYVGYTVYESKEMAVRCKDGRDPEKYIKTIEITDEV